ncbi:NTE family protein [Natronospira proteinivora]|uniref:NTE family protein n=1 Tax=Natronospira proteinivora TaxID=1807133 RepID=A0ABT1G685_9GAMM|nr:patatin-like phospholipase RssA [Natronospira proteinivora]MCP1726809.1 NTE family protein [Natronospira proteinivora]
MSSKQHRRTKIGLALGSGSARGWSHIGVIRALEKQGIRPDIVAGTSIGALVGGAYRVDRLDTLEEWVRGLERMDILRLLDYGLSGGGFMRGEKLMDAIGQRVKDVNIEDLPAPFAAVATDLNSGREIWLNQGSLLDAVRASIALPGLFAPVQQEGRWLMDGGLVNPVPVSLCRAMGADVVIAVNLNGDIMGRNFDNRAIPGNQPSEQDVDKLTTEEKDPGSDVMSRIVGHLKSGLRVRVDRLISSAARKQETSEPGLFDVLAGSVNVVQDRITRSRMAGDPPDILITPRLAHIRLMEFDRASEAILGGEKAVERAREDLQALGPNTDNR